MRPRPASGTRVASRRWLGGALWLLSGGAHVACGSAAAPECVDWKADVSSALAQACGECHDEDTASGGYRTDTYLEAIGDGSDEVPNAVQADAGSRLITMLANAPAGDPHADQAETLELVRRWIVECRVAWSLASPHEAGILNPDDHEQFHRRRVEDALYDLSVCADCHGTDLTGGRGDDCTACHANPMTSCDACHAAPTSGAHADHLESGLTGAAACSACHAQPSTLLAPGHVLTADGAIDPPPAEVTFGSFASQGIGGGAAFEAKSGTCTVYCHGDGFSDANRTATTMQWGTSSGVSGCESCHGMPPQSHTTDDDCGVCHGRVSGTAFDSGLHIDGQISLGSDETSCSGCHGVGAGGWPPPDLSGSSSTASLGVGAHTAHLAPPGGMMGPIACGACHLRPATVDDPGHLDSLLPAEVFPAAIAATSPAFFDGLTPTWQRGPETCGDYCHGNGSLFDGDATVGRITNPAWTDVGNDQAACGTCHGVPPDDGFHAGGLTAADCGNCHGATVDGTGAIIVIGGASQHIDGTLD